MSENSSCSGMELEIGDNSEREIRKEEKEYITNGENHLLDAHDDSGGAAVLFPSIFSHPYIEEGDAECAEGSSNFPTYQHNRKSAETEHSVYTAFQRFFKGKPEYSDSVLMHSFKYDVKTLEHLGIKVDEVFYPYKGKPNNNPEHDFVIILNNKVFVVVEVKTSVNMEAIKSAKRQLETAETFIKKVYSNYSDECPKIINVAAFPKVEEAASSNWKCCHCCFRNGLQDVFVLDKTSVDTQEGFSAWWVESIQQQIQAASNNNAMKQVTDLFVGIWASKNKGNITEIEIIETIDERLREANLCQGSKEKVMTNDVFPLGIKEDIIPVAVQTFIKENKSFPIKSLTADQLEVLKEEYKHCFIRGPGGSGKTVAMLVNVIRLSKKKSDRRLIVIICHDKDCAETLKKPLEGCDKEFCDKKCCDIQGCNEEGCHKEGCHKVKVEICSFNKFVKEKKTIDCSNDVVIVDTYGTRDHDYYTIRQFIELTHQCHVFVDNLQHTYNCFVPTLFLMLSNNQYCWFLCDELQGLPDITKKYLLQYPKNFSKIFSFLKVVRSTKEISEASLAIRTLVETLFPPGKRCKAFHLIHGPKPRLYILNVNGINKQNQEKVLHDYVKYFVKRYQKLGRESLAILSTGFPGTVETWKSFDIKYNIASHSAMAHEFTAVLGFLNAAIVDVNGDTLHQLHSDLYMMLSRARVVAEIIIVCDGLEFDAKPFKDKFEIFHIHLATILCIIS